MDPTETAWLDALLARHTASLTRPELLKAIRALSARYVERRDRLATRSPLDSDGKRAAFAAFYAPLHYFTMQQIVRALALPASLSTIVDLGCGTGTASAAWARSFATRPVVRGIDRHPWAVSEAAWTWRALDVDGRARRGNMSEPASLKTGNSTSAAFLCAWSVNELDASDRVALLARLLVAAERGATVLVVEPIARSATPWWDDWSTAVTGAGGRADSWRFDVALPPALADLDQAAGFTREGLTAKSLFFTPPVAPGPDRRARPGAPAVHSRGSSRPRA